MTRAVSSEEGYHQMLSSVLDLSEPHPFLPGVLTQYGC